MLLTRRFTCWREEEITARGVALMMRRGLDGIAPDADAPAIEGLIEPEPERRSVAAPSARAAAGFVSASLWLIGQLRAAIS